MKEDVYGLLLDLYDLTIFSSPAKEWCKNLFSPDSIGSQYVEQIYNARIRLAERLDTNIEDRDLIDLVEGYESLQKLLSFTMFEYGTLLGDKKDCKQKNLNAVTEEDQ